MINHRDWMELAAEEYRRLDRVLAALTPQQWEAPTDCSGWRVRDIVAHLIGAAEATASIREQLRQQRAGTKARANGDEPQLQIDAVNDLQVRERADLTPDELRGGLTNAGRRGLRARTRMPAVVRALRFPFPPPLGWAGLGYLSDAIYTRDAWMHRIDICRATGQPPELTADHDGRIIADAARAWQRAGGPAALILTGPAGVTLPDAGPPTSEPATFDAVELARALSGRGRLPGIPDDAVLF